MIVIIGRSGAAKVVRVEMNNAFLPRSRKGGNRESKVVKRNKAKQSKAKLSRAEHRNAKHYSTAVEGGLPEWVMASPNDTPTVFESTMRTFTPAAAAASWTCWAVFPCGVWVDE